IFFGSKSVGSAETTSCSGARPKPACCRNGALPISRPIHFTGWVSHPQTKTTHGNWLWKCWRNAGRLSAVLLRTRNGYSAGSNVATKALVLLQQISDTDID